jgi:HNH endonuclease
MSGASARGGLAIGNFFVPLHAPLIVGTHLFSFAARCSLTLGQHLMPIAFVHAAIPIRLHHARINRCQWRLGRRPDWLAAVEVAHGLCAVTGCAISAMLRASHIKPWSKSSNHDRLNPANGILLAAHIDSLFDSGLISFADDGKMIVSAQIADDLRQLQLPERLRRRPTKEERQFLA